MYAYSLHDCDQRESRLLTYARAETLHDIVDVTDAFDVIEIEREVVCLLLRHGAVRQAGVRHTATQAALTVIATVYTQTLHVQCTYNADVTQH